MSFVTMATNLPSCFSNRFLEQFLKFLVNFTLFKYIKSQRSYGFLITKELIFGFQISDLKDHFSAYLTIILCGTNFLFGGYEAEIHKLSLNSFSEPVYVISKPYGLK